MSRHRLIQRTFARGVPSAWRGSSAPVRRPIGGLVGAGPPGGGAAASTARGHCRARRRDRRATGRGPRTSVPRDRCVPEHVGAQQLGQHASEERAQLHAEGQQRDPVEVPAGLGRARQQPQSRDGEHAAHAVRGQDRAVRGVLRQPAVQSPGDLRHRPLGVAGRPERVTRARQVADDVPHDAERA